MYSLKPDITEEYILKRVSQEEIFYHYLGVPVQYHERFCSPIRNDKNPTCTFKKQPSGLIIYRDWAEPEHYSCFSIVKRIYNCDMFSAIRHIYVDMLIENKPIVHQIKIDKSSNNQKSNKSIIQVEFDKWQPEVISYLKSYHLDSETCKKFNIFPIKTVFLNGTIHYRYNPNDPAIGYYFGNNGEHERWKIYFIKRRSKFRFLCNTNRINGWIQLPESGKQLVITKSLKDVACLSLFNIPAIAMQNETTLPYDYIIEEMKERFEHIVSLYDYDMTGIRLATELKELYHINPLFFKNVDKVKDFSDYLKVHGKQKTQRLIDYVQTYLAKNR